MKKIIIFLKLIFCIIIFLWSTIKTNAQEGRLIGIVDFNLVEIDTDGTLTFITTVNAPSDLLIQNLAYVPSECLFYAIIDATASPSLVSIDLEGNYTEIGPLNLPGETVFLCEGLTYNKSNDMLYAGTSLNGGISNNDYSSESLLIVDPTDATCTFVTALSTSSSPYESDFDDIVIIDDILYYHDGVPDQNISFFHQFDLIGIGASVVPTEILSVAYQANTDMAAIEDILYIPTALTNGFYSFNSNTNNLTYITQTHLLSEYDEQAIRGIDYVPYNETLSFLNVDTLLCDEETITFSVNWNDADVLWNTGTTTNDLIVNEEGLYWANISLNNCFYTTDTAMVAFEECDTCLIIQNQILLGNDTTICIDQTFEINLDLDSTFEVTWNNGETGPSIILDESGMYWANIAFDTCNFTTDIFNLTVMECQSCADIESQIQDQLFIGNDTTICMDQQFEINLPLDNSFDINWSTGETGPSINVEEAGSYWANISFDTCNFVSDTLALNLIDCDTCMEVQNQIQNILQIKNDTSICLEEALEINLDLNSTFDINWSDGTIGPSISLNEAGIYWANISIDACNFVSDTISLSFIDCIDCQYYIPNAFSPNQDGHNDLFKVYFDEVHCHLVSFEMSIYDRWGALILQTDQNEWDGYYKDKPLNPGVYAYVVMMTINHNDTLIPFFETGDITIIK